MDFLSAYTEILRQERVLTPRQKDILDTENEMLKSPFDRNTAIRQVRKNSMNYPELARGAIMLLIVKGKMLEQMNNNDIWKILKWQFAELIG